MRKILFIALCLFFLNGLTVAETRAQSGAQFLQVKVRNNEGAINGAFYRAYGRSAAPAEMSQWRQSDVTVGELISRLIEFLKGQAGAEELRQVIERSYPPSFGRAPTPKESAFWQSEARAKGYGFYSLMNNAYHEWLKTPEADAERKSLDFRAFFEVYGRLPTVVESNDYRDSVEKNGENYSEQIEWLLDRMLLPASFLVAGNKYEAMTNELHNMIKRAFITAGKGQPTEAQYAAWTAEAKA